VLLLDLELGTTCALDSLLDLREALERTRIVILSSHHDDLRVFKALEHGADAYLVKASTPPAELLGAIEKVCQGEAPLSGSVARRVIESFRKQRADQIALESLTQRESQTFDLLATGASNREIAQEMNIAEGTVRTHVHNVLRKLHVSTRTRAIRAASRRIR
jgi:DNA-binding NarL/FixJ family response regulator